MIRCEVPLLRERPDDIVALVSHFIAAFNRTFGINVIHQRHPSTSSTSKTKRSMPSCTTIGRHVRELKNDVEAAFANLTDDNRAILAFPPQFRKTSATADIQRR